MAVFQKVKPCNQIVMAQIIKENGGCVEIAPENGKNFTLAEMQKNSEIK